MLICSAQNMKPVLSSVRISIFLFFSPVLHVFRRLCRELMKVDKIHYTLFLYFYFPLRKEIFTTTSYTFKTYWLRDTPISLTFNNCTLCPHCIYVFCIYLRTNNDLYHLQHKLIGFYSRDGKCLQRGTDWVFTIK